MNASRDFKELPFIDDSLFSAKSRQGQVVIEEVSEVRYMRLASSCTVNLELRKTMRSVASRSLIMNQGLSKGQTALQVANVMASHDQGIN